MGKELAISGFFLQIMCFTSVCQHQTPCARIEFPTLDSSLTVTAEENDTIQIPFTIAECKHLGADFTIEIKGEDELSRICVIRVRGKECFPYKSCSCTEDGAYQLEKTMSRTDSGKWTWTDRDAIIGDVTVTVNVTYPVRLTKFSLTSHASKLQGPANQGDTITVHCDYEEGNPPLLPTIVDRHGVMLPTHKDNQGTTMTYTLYDVSCDDAGELRCEAPGASVNKTATLLVKCPPQFVTGQNQTVSVENDVITFDIRTHRDRMTGCSLTHSEETEKKIYCLGSINITGTPPDLVLTVPLDNVTKQDEGLWQLSVTNDVGSGNVDFWLGVPATDTGTSSPGVSTNTPRGSDKRSTNEGVKPRTILAIGVGVVMFTVTLVVIGITICVVRKRNSGAKRRRLATQRADIHIDSQHRQQDVVINHAADGLAERHVIPEGQQDGACGKSAPVRGKAGWEGMEGTSRKSAREPGDGSDTYVNVPTLKKKKKKTAHPEETTGNAEGAAGLAEKTARNASDEDDEEKDGDGEGLTYVQLDFSGKRARSVTIQPLPRTDYAEVNFRADPPPNPEDTDQ